MRFIEGEFYHLYNRGVDKRTIFTSITDYKRFLALLYLANSTEDVRIANILKDHAYEEIYDRDRGKSLVAIGAFCLMPNHFHILVTPIVEDGISKFMLKLQTGYSMYFNTKNNRSGSLFQGPFKSEHADEDVYLKYLFSYIHLNPAKLKDKKWKENIKIHAKNLRMYVEKYPYSSLGAYVSEKHIITNPTFFPNYFSSRNEIKNHITDWLERD
ncbi:MAG TPA: transposase [Candidatus Paceibacterota bacterium]|nr:transposase [Candidatus Paceibacterota bacterium]